ncbi:hypothetical protein RMATCC62417_13690 [Rhizopus microsporus]|nr:hypothetical protein RMATCC62417_13690 [Rhizopus microsporus]
MYISNSLLLLAAGAAQVYAATSTKNSYLPQVSPSFPNMKPPAGAVTSYNPGPYDTSSSLSTETLKGYPEPWSSPDTNHARSLLKSVPDAAFPVLLSAVPYAKYLESLEKVNFNPFDPLLQKRDWKMPLILWKSYKSRTI